MKALVLVAAAALFVAGNAHAASCEPSLFPQSLNLRSARVTAPKAALFNDPEACSRSVGLCRSKAYLVAGDAVLAAQTETGMTCVAFIGRKRSTIGWVDAAALAPMPNAPPAVDWTGHWSRSVGDAEATIERKGKSLSASLSASAEGGRSDNMRTGGADGDLIVHDDRAELTNRGDAKCRVHLRGIGAYLIVNDGASDDANSPCGGIGVTLNGVYVHTGR
ncbi:hypothetical protein [Sphingomonas sp. PAMC 26605]|uniref:hypothetical protein n=1 Tax=Sphingomonas sp. PAMC 26605 TaxID=1112214 RepID=UPI0012F492A5|nr:hypothetical protein [Sphingomonas sp. PAMC 26605]